jgi:hypothetical protein
MVLLREKVTKSELWEDRTLWTLYFNIQPTETDIHHGRVWENGKGRKYGDITIFPRASVRKVSVRIKKLLVVRKSKDEWRKLHDADLYNL